MPTAVGADKGSLRRRLVRAAPGLFLLYGLGLAVVSSLTVGHAGLAVALTIGSWLASTALILLAVAGFAAAGRPRPQLAALLVIGSCGWVLLAYVYATPERAAPLAVHTHDAARTLCMMLAATAFGTLVGGLFREPSLLPPALVLAGVVDIIGVKYGLVAKVASENLETIAMASATLPAVASTAATRFPLDSLTIGPGDIVFAALIFGVVARAGWDLRSNLIWMFGLSVTGLGLVMLSGWLVPGLVFIGLAGIVANRGRFAYTADERRALMIATALVLATLALVSIGIRGLP